MAAGLGPIRLTELCRVAAHAGSRGFQPSSLPTFYGCMAWKVRRGVEVLRVAQYGFRDVRACCAIERVQACVEQAGGGQANGRPPRVSRGGARETRSRGGFLVKFET